jgi:hypothetical protein
MMNRWTILLGVLALSACAEGPVPWQKPGASDADIQTALNICVKQSRSDSREVLDDQINGFSAPPIENMSVPSDGTMRDIDRQALADEEKQIRRDSLYRCMILAGYRPLKQ